MAKRFELIVFDWDGTILDSAAAIVSAIQSAARDLGVAEPCEERARHVIGLGLGDAIRSVLPELPEERFGLLADRYRLHYLAGDRHLKTFPGIDSLLTALRRRGHRLAIATGKSRAGLARALEHTGLASFFETSRCADECRSKPDPQMLEEIMTETAVLPGATLMIGDTTHDLLMARQASVAGLAVTYGAHSRAVLESVGAFAMMDSVEELGEWLTANA